MEKNEIEKIENRKAPTSYGSRWVPGYGRVHNLGKEGLQCYRVSGKKIFFGTGQLALFRQAMDKLLDANPKFSLREF